MGVYKSYELFSLLFWKLNELKKMMSLNIIDSSLLYNKTTYIKSKKISGWV